MSSMMFVAVQSIHLTAALCCGEELSRCSSTLTDMYCTINNVDTCEAYSKLRTLMTLNVALTSHCLRAPT